MLSVGRNIVGVIRFLHVQSPYAQALHLRLVRKLSIQEKPRIFGVVVLLPAMSAGENVLFFRRSVSWVP